MEIEVLEFQVPAENNKMLLVWGIEPGHTRAQVQEQLLSVFSCFGPLYLLKVSSSAPPSPPGFSALIRFYSALQASRAQRHTDGQLLFQTSPLKVRLGSRQAQRRPPSGTRRSLGHSHCVELANHFLGFNGWRSGLLALQQLPDEEQAAEGGAASRSLRLGCELQLCFPAHSLSVRAAAVVEDGLTCTGDFGSTPPGQVALLRRCQLQRLVRERALVQAFSKVLLILIGEKVMLEVKHSPDQLTPVLTEGTVQVSEFAPNRDEEEEVATC